MLSVRRITEILFYNNNLIVYDEIEEYTYAIKILILKILHIVVFISISIVWNCFFPMIIFLSIFSFIRSRIGGYHAATWGRCVLISYIIGIAFCLSVNIPSVIRLKEYIFILNVFIIFYISRIESKLLIYLVIMGITMIFLPYEFIIAVFLGELFSLILYYLSSYLKVNTKE